MKKLFTTLTLALAFVFAGLNVNAQCNDIFTNITANSSFYSLSFQGTTLFDGPTCGPLFITPANVLVTGDLILFNVECGNTYTWTTCGLVTFDSYIRIWEDDPANNFPLLASNDDDFGCGANIFASTLTWTSDRTAQIWLSVNEWICDPTGQVAYDMLMQCTPGGGCSAPANDFVCNAQFIGIPTSAGTTVQYDNNYATPDGPSPGAGTGASSCNSLDGWCSFETDVDNDVWFSFIAPASGNVDIEAFATSGSSDNQLALWQMDDCFSAQLSAVEIAADDDLGVGFNARIFDLCGAIQLTPFELYYIQLDGYNGSEGAGDLTVTEIASGGPTPNDEACTAVVIPSAAPGQSSSATYDNTCATSSGISPGGSSTSPTCDGVDGWCSFETDSDNDVWFMYTIPAGSGGTITFGSEGDLAFDDTQIAVWNANGDCANYAGFTELGANDDGGAIFGSSVTIDCIDQGATVMIQVDGYNGDVHSGTVTVTDEGIAPLEADGGECGTVWFGYTFHGDFGCTELNGSAMGGVAGYTYEWFNQNGDVVGTTPSITVCPEADDYYTLCVTDQRGCTACDATPTYVQSIDVRCGANAKQLTHKVTVCHVPPGNPANAHDICIDYHGVPAHLLSGGIGHGTCYLGPCDQLTCDGQPFSGPHKAASGTAVDLFAEAFPNPFSSTTTIQFTFEHDENVVVEVYDLTGAKVATLFKGRVLGGMMNVVDFDASDLGSGVYIYRISSENGKVHTDKLYLMK